MRGFSLSWIALCLVLVGCTRGGQKKEPPAVDAPTEAAPSEGKAGPSDDPDWLAGRIPASVMEGTPKQGGQVVVSIGAEPPSLNDIVDSDWLAARITTARIYEGLTRTDPYDHPDYKHVPALAERWEISDDKLVYTYYLRKGVKWHDGNPFSAKDVIATFDKIQDLTTKAAHLRSYTEELEKYEALDDHTVRFTWKRPYFLTMDTLGGANIQPAHIIGKLTGQQYNEAASNPINRAPVGTGPWKFGQWESQQKIVLERNDDYWGDKVHLDKLVFRIVKDESVALQLAERGDLDVFYGVKPDQWVNMDSEVFKKDFHRSRFHGASYSWVGWNAGAKTFLADKKVRRALTMLTDRPGIIEKVMYGLPMETTCHFYWASNDCDPNIKPLPFDPLAAVKLLDEAGWRDTDGDGIRDKDGVKFALTLMVPASSSNGVVMATKMKEDFTKASIELDLQKVEWSAFTKRLREHSFDACLLSWGGDSRGDPTQIWHSKSRKGGSNYIDYSNPEVDKLIEDARVMFDVPARQTLYKKFSAILHEEQPYTWLLVPARLSLLNKRIKGVKESLSWYQFEDWWVE